MVWKNYLTNGSKHAEADVDIGLQWWISRGRSLLLTTVVVVGVLGTEAKWPQVPDRLRIIGIPVVVGGFLVWTILTAALLILFGEKIALPTGRPCS